MPTVKKRPQHQRPPLFPLQRILDDAGVSYSEAARRTGITRELLRGYAKGHVYPTWPTIWVIALAMGLNLGHLQPVIIREET